MAGVVLIVTHLLIQRLNLHISVLFSGSLVGYILGLPQWISAKESTCNIGDLVQSLGQEDSPKQDMATHPSILPWEIPWEATVDAVTKSQT